MVLNPRVKIDVQSNITLTQPGGPGIIALIGSAQWGATDELKAFSSFSQLLDHYKEDKSSLTLVKGADLAYGNGAVTIKAIRIGGAGIAKATLARDGNSGAETDVLTFSGFFEGTNGNNILVTILTQGTGRTVTITDGVDTENFTNSNATNGLETNQAIADAINASSVLVTVAVKAGSETSNLVDAATQSALTGGDDGLTLTSSLYTTAFDNFLDNELWDILIAPGDDSVNGQDSFATTLVGKVNTRESSNQKYGVVFLGTEIDESISTIQARTSAGKRLSMLSPSIKYTPRFDAAGNQITLNGTFLACAYAGIVASRDVEIAPTRKLVSVEELLVDSSSGAKFYNNAEIEQLLEAKVVAVSSIEGAVKVSRGITRIADNNDIEFELNIVRIIDFVRKQTQEKLDGFLGDPNLERVRDVMAAEVNGILTQAKLDEVIAEFLPTEVNEGASPDTVNVSMTIQPTFAVNFINVVLAVSRL